MSERDTRTAAQKNRAIRQEALRDQLANQKHVEHVVDMVEKIRDPSNDIDNQMLNRYKIAIDTKLALIKKYIPDLKATEHSGPGGEDLFSNFINAIKPTTGLPSERDSGSS